MAKANETKKAINLNKEVFGFNFIKCECGGEMGVRDINSEHTCTTCQSKITIK